MKTKVLFVCTENSARSQMAEGFLRHHGGDDFEAFSGGAEPTRLNPLAVEVMKEVGIDISGHHAKDVAEFLGQNFQYLIRVCDKVREKCPVLPGAVWYLDWSFEDPATAAGAAAERLAVFRRVRDEIETHVREFIVEPPLRG
ncbi:MAG TPA: arsenate reductase ArsC [Terriglobia bacterium]|nr:arsenate reductase ArsC [Terriglobia bacterium]